MDRTQNSRIPGRHFNLWATREPSWVAKLCPNLHDPMDWSPPDFTVLHYLLEIAQCHVHWITSPSNHLILCCSLYLLPSVFHSIRVCYSESALHIRWPRYRRFSFSTSPSNKYSELISFWIDWFDLLAVQGTLKSLLQHHNSKVSILWCSAFFMVQLSHLYLTTGNTVALTVWIFARKMMSLFFNMLSNILLWKIPSMEDTGGLQSMGSRRVRPLVSDFTFTFQFQALKKEMATYSSVLAWRIPGMGEPGGLPSMGLHWVGHNWSDLASAVAAAAVSS